MPKKRAELRIDKATTAGTGNVTINGNGATTAAFPGIPALDARYALLSTYTAHAADPDAHHDKKHDITSAAHHTTTAGAGYVLGTSAAQTLGMLATTADGAANHSTLLKSNASGGLTLDSLRAPLIDTASGNLTLQPAADLVIDPDDEAVFQSDITTRSSNFAAPSPFTTGFSLHPYPENANKHRLQIGRIEADELIVKLFTADETLVRRGSDWLTSTFGIVARDEYNDVGEYTVPAEDGTVNIWFHDSPHTSGALFTNNEWVMLQFFERDAGITVVEIWGQVSSYTTDANHDEMQRWTFTNRTSGVSGYKIKPGMTFFGFGSSGDGWIYRTVLGGGPREKFVTWSGSNPRDGTNTLRVQLGDLTDVSGSNLDPSGYGLYGSNVFLEGDFYAAAGDVVMTTDGTSWKADTVESSTWTDYGNKISWMVDPLVPSEAGIVTQAWATRYSSGADTIGDFWLVTKAGGTSALTDATINLQAEDSPYTALVSVQVTNSAPYIVLSSGDSGSTQDATMIVGGRANTITVSGGPTTPKLSPASDLGAQLGEPSYRWSALHVDELYADAEIVAGTLTGSTWAYSGSSMFVNVNNNAGTGTLYVRNNLPGYSADIDVEGDAFVHGDIVVDGLVDSVNIGDLKSDYDGHIVDGAHTELDIDNNAVVGGTLGVTGVATLANNATVGGTLGVTGVATLGDDATVGGTLDVTGSATVGGALGVTGAVTGSDTISGTSLIASTSVISPILRPASDSTTAIKLANSSGTAVLTVDTITPGVEVGAKLSVDGNVTFTGNLSNDTFSVNNSGQLILSAPAPVFDLRDTDSTAYWRIRPITHHLYIEPEGTDESSQIRFRDNANNPLLYLYTGDLSAVFYGDVDIAGDLAVSADIIGSVIKPASDATDALVLADSSGNAILTVDTINDDVDITGDLDITANSTVGGTLGVTGAGTFSSTLGVTGTLTASGAATVGTTLGVSGATTLSSTLGVTGKITGSDDLTLAGTFDGPQIDIKSGGTTYGRIDSTGITSVTPAFTSGDNAQGWKVTWDGHLTAREVTAVTLSSFVFEMRQVHAIGSTLIVTPAGRLNTAATMPTAIGGSGSIQLRNPDGEEGQIFQVGDVLRISAISYSDIPDSGEDARLYNPALFYMPGAVLEGMQGISTVWLTVTDATAGSGYWTYDYTLSDGSINVVFPSGTAVVKWGQSGDGLIRISSDDYDGYTPYMSVSTVTDTPWTGDNDIIRLGRLDGIAQITGGKQYGLAISTDWSDSTAPQFVASTVGGLYTKNLTQQWNDSEGESIVRIDPDDGITVTAGSGEGIARSLTWVSANLPDDFPALTMYGSHTTGDSSATDAVIRAYNIVQTGYDQSVIQIQSRLAASNELSLVSDARILVGAYNDSSQILLAADSVRLQGDLIMAGSDSVATFDQITTETLTVQSSGDGQGIRVRLRGLPTSSTGLLSGELWDDSGTLKVA